MTSNLSTPSFLSHLQALDIVLYLEDGGLRFRAPQGVFTAALREQVQLRKPELLALLGQAACTIARLAPGQNLRMSYAQERIWFLYRFEGPSSTYNITPVFRVRGPLSLPALRAALAALADRHDTLRMHFAEVDGIGIQIVDPLPAVPLEIICLRDRVADAEALILEQTARPFDLERGPLLRVTLLELGDDDYILLPFMHHIIADGWSLGLFHHEFGQFYQHFDGGPAPTLAPLAIQYPDYAAWQRARHENDAEALRFWREALDGAPQTLSLPTDFVRPAQQSFNGRVLRQQIPPALTEALHALARTQGCSLFMVLLAAYGVLMLRRCGQDDILIGSPVANRPLRETEGLIGCFVNTVVLRLQMQGNPAFSELLGRVRAMALDAYAHQDVPIEAVIDAVALRRDPARNALYQAQFSLQNVPLTSAALSRISVTPMPMDRVAAKNDLSFILEQGANGIEVEIEYNTDLFAEPAVAQLGRDYLDILAQVTAEPHSPLLVATAAERATSERVIAPRFDSLSAAFAHAAASHPQACAVRDSAGTLDYAALDAQAELVAQRLLALELAPGTPVGLLMRRSGAMLAAMLGILKAGAAYLPLAPEHPGERLTYCLRQGGAGALLVDGATLALGTSVAAPALPVLNLDEAWAPAPARPVPVIKATDLAYIIFTSGSSGQPKGVMVEHGAVLNLVAALRHEVYAGLGEGLQVALVASTVFDASVQQIFPALLHGHSLCLIDDALRQDGERLCRQLAHWRIDVCDCTPSLLSIMLAAGLAEHCGATLRHLLVGGEALPRDLLLSLYRSGAGRQIAVSNVYGPTECCVDTTCLRIDPARLPAAAIMPLGRALANCAVLVVDEDSRPVAPGVTGELLISGAGLARGYVGDPEQTAQRFVTLASGVRAYRSGDLGRRLADGTLEYLGRNDAQVKILGHRIELTEIESRLREHAAIRAVSVQAPVTSMNYQQLAAYVVSDSALTRAELIAFIGQRLPAYMVPTYFVAMAALPLNASGKVDARALPDPESAPALASGVEHRAAGSAAEEALCAVWESTLRIARPGVGDNYFASGGDSIKALQVAARLRQAGWIMQMRDLFQYPTIEQLAPRLTPAPHSVAAAACTGPAALSAVQRFFFDVYGPARQFNQAILLRLRQPVSAPALRRALAVLHAEHDMLRCRFSEQDGVWSQEILAPDQVTPQLELVELRAADQLAALCAQAQRGFVLEQAPLMHALLVEVPDGQRLLLCAHHLIIDGVSWRILLEDLELLLDGAAGLAARSCSYPAWVASQQRYAVQHPAAELEVWRGTGWAQPAGGTHADRRELGLTLSAELTASLSTGAHLAYSTEINDLLIAALARAWCSWSGDVQCAITLEGHGRESLVEPLDLTRSVGWFTSIFPLAITLTGDDPGRHIKQVKETLRALPHKGAGYGVLRYMAAADGLAPLPPLAFNYLGRFDAAASAWFEPAPEQLGPSAAPELALAWPLEINAAVLADRMQLTLAYDQRRYQGAQAQELLERFADQLDQVVRHALARHGPELTLSDIDYDGFTSDGLDAFLDSL